LIETIRNQGPNRKRLKSRDPITIYLGSWLQNCIKHPRTKLEISIWNWKRCYFFETIHCLLQIKWLAIKTGEAIAVDITELQSRGGTSRDWTSFKTTLSVINLRGTEKKTRIPVARKKRRRGRTRWTRGKANEREKYRSKTCCCLSLASR
jgi:hypothetical protein